MKAASADRRDQGGARGMTGQEFKALRKAAGLTQQALGDMAGTSRRAIAKYEAGDIDLGQIEVKTAIKLAAALGIPVEQFGDTAP